MASTIDWTAVNDHIGKTLTTRLRTLIEGAEEDAAKYLAEIAADLTTALSLGDESLISEINAQLKALAEKNRLRISDQGLGTMATLIEDLGGMALAVTAAIL